MINIFQSHRLDHFQKESSFVIDAQGQDVSIVSGEVIRLGTKSKDVAGIVVDKPKSDEEIEVYLHILTKPLSNRIINVNILNQEEVEKQKQNSDDLLNIYLPLSRAEKNDAGQFSEFQANDNIDTNFLWVKENKDKPFACYYDRDKVYITGYLLTGSDISTKPKSSIEVGQASEGKALVLEISAKVDESKDEGEGFFVLEKYEVKVKDVSDCSIEVKEDTIILNADGGLSLLKGDFSDTLEINYPIGFIDQGNFIHGKLPNNIQIGVEKSSLDFFLKEDVDEINCPFSVFADTRSFYIKVL